ncbi:Uncharacterised protein [Vibrio cholerae]|nr:Uncharacterised protein [Vibrio cholerae]
MSLCSSAEKLASVPSIGAPSSSALWHLPQFGLSVIRSSGTRLRLWQDGQRVLNVDMTSSLYFALSLPV